MTLCEQIPWRRERCLPGQAARRCGAEECHERARLCRGSREVSAARRQSHLLDSFQQSHAGGSCAFHQMNRAVWLLPPPAWGQTFSSAVPLTTAPLSSKLSQTAGAEAESDGKTAPTTHPSASKRRRSFAHWGKRRAGRTIENAATAAAAATATASWSEIKPVRKAAAGGAALSRGAELGCSRTSIRLPGSHWGGSGPADP